MRASRIFEEPATKQALFATYGFAFRKRCIHFLKIINWKSASRWLDRTAITTTTFIVLLHLYEKITTKRKISIGNSTVSRGIWDKYREWYFKTRQNITSRRGEWYLGSFQISRAGIYPKYPEETVLFSVYTTRQRNFAFHITQEHIFLFSHAQLIGFTTTCDWL